MKDFSQLGLRAKANRITKDVFSTMVHRLISFEAIDYERFSEGRCCYSSVQIHGDLEGGVLLNIDYRLAVWMTVQMLGWSSGELDDETVYDVVG